MFEAHEIRTMLSAARPRLKAMREAIKTRPAAKSNADADLAFITKCTQ
jgi:hypothetical protein